MRPFRPREHSEDPWVTEQPRQNDEGEWHLVYRCRSCGTESQDPALQWGCWTCDAGVGWR